jgi:hypothetical protein
MPEVLKRDRMTPDRLPRMFRSRTVDYALLVVGAVIAAFGAYTYFAPDAWFLGDLTEAWYLGSWIAGGVVMGGGFGLLGASLRDRAGYWTASAITSFVLGIVAIAGAVAAAVVLII